MNQVLGLVCHHMHHLTWPHSFLKTTVDIYCLIRLSLLGIPCPQALMLANGQHCRPMHLSKAWLLRFLLDKVSLSMAF
jgi:hypothetical protein